jgi:hypothetical protein
MSHGDAMKKQPSYVVNGILASCALYFVLRLSSSGRTTIDWVVIGLVVLAVFWNLFRLGQRLNRAGGGKDLWHLQRTLLFWVIGLLNTAWIRSVDVGSWKNVIGWCLVVLATLDTVMLYRKERASMPQQSADSSGEA